MHQSVLLSPILERSKSRASLSNLGKTCKFCPICSSWIQYAPAGMGTRVTGRAVNLGSSCTDDLARTWAFLFQWLGLDSWHPSPFIGGKSLVLKETWTWGLGTWYQRLGLGRDSDPKTCQQILFNIWKARELSIQSCLPPWINPSFLPFPSLWIVWVSCPVFNEAYRGWNWNPRSSLNLLDNLPILGSSKTTRGGPFSSLDMSWFACSIDFRVPN